MFAMPEAIIVASIIIAVGMLLSAWIVARRLSVKSPVPIQSFPMPSVLPSLVPLPPEAFPVEPSGIPVEPETSLEIGTPVLANWNGAWWRAQVIGHERDGRVRIHYVGWDSSWDTTLTRGELQMDISSSVNE